MPTQYLELCGYCSRCGLLYSWVGKRGVWKCRKCDSVLGKKPKGTCWKAALERPIAA